MKKTMIFTMILMLFASINLIAETLPEPPANFHDVDAGTEQNPYQIANLANLRWLSETPEVWGSLEPLHRFYYIQTADIDATETREWHGWFKSFGSETVPFVGNYDGQKYAISNLSGYGGLFYLTRESELANIFLHRAYADVEGSLIQYSENSIIFNCHVSGIISTCSSGGFIGFAANSDIINCSSSVDTYFVCGSDSHHEISAFIGEIDGGVVLNSYFNGSIRGIRSFNAFSGFIGRVLSEDTIIENCYVTTNTPMISTSPLTHCYPFTIIHGNATYMNIFWDMETTEITSSYPGIGLTTAQMKSAATFIDAGWDFDNVWDIHPSINDGYPYLQSQHERPSSDFDDVIPEYAGLNLQNYPNPFNPETTIRWQVAGDRQQETHVTIDIYNVKGQLVRKLVNDIYSSGVHSVVWNGRDEAGRAVGSGIYLYRVKAGEHSSIQKMLLLK